MTTEKVSPEILQAIWNVHGLGPITTMVQPSGGAVNQTWIINDALIIRFDVIDWGGINRYAGEKRAYEALYDLVPVPRVLVLDSAKTLVPYTYLIMTKVPGKTISASLHELTEEARHKLAYTAGEYLAMLHRHTFDGFGLLFEIAAGTNKPDWAAYVNDFIQEYAQQSRDLSLVSDEVITRVNALTAKMQPLLESVKQGHFVHGDYHFSNLLQENGQITGVIDFEWALSGDPSWDFRVDDYFELDAPGSKAAFYAGYTQHRALPDHHQERVSFYRIGLYLDHLATFAPTDAHELTVTLPLLMKEIEWLETHL